MNNLTRKCLIEIPLWYSPCCVVYCVSSGSGECSAFVVDVIYSESWYTERGISRVYDTNTHVTLCINKHVVHTYMLMKDKIEHYLAKWRQCWCVNHTEELTVYANETERQTRRRMLFWNISYHTWTSLKLLWYKVKWFCYYVSLFMTNSYCIQHIRTQINLTHTGCVRDRKERDIHGYVSKMKGLYPTKWIGSISQTPATSRLYCIFMPFQIWHAAPQQYYRDACHI